MAYIILVLDKPNLDIFLKGFYERFEDEENHAAFETLLNDLNSPETIFPMANVNLIHIQTKKKKGEVDLNIPTQKKQKYGPKLYVFFREVVSLKTKWLIKSFKPSQFQEWRYFEVDLHQADIEELTREIEELSGEETEILKDLTILIKDFTRILVVVKNIGNRVQESYDTLERERENLATQPFLEVRKLSDEEKKLKADIEEIKGKEFEEMHKMDGDVRSILDKIFSISERQIRELFEMVRIDKRAWNWRSYIKIITERNRKIRTLMTMISQDENYYVIGKGPLKRFVQIIHKEKFERLIGDIYGILKKVDTLLRDQHKPADEKYKRALGLFEAIINRLEHWREELVKFIQYLEETKDYCKELAVEDRFKQLLRYELDQSKEE